MISTGLLSRSEFYINILKSSETNIKKKAFENSVTKPGISQEPDI